MESEADLRTAETKLEQAVGEQARCSEGLQAIMQPLQQHAMQLHSSLGSLLPLLSTCDGIADVSSMLQDLHRAIQVGVIACQNVHATFVTSVMCGTITSPGAWPA